MKLTKLLTKIGAIVALVAVVSSSTVFAVDIGYRDVSPKHWAYESIVKVTEAGLMHGKGKPAGTYFDKSGNVTAAEIYTTLYRLAGEPEVEPVFENTFELRGYSSGTYNKKWYAKEVNWAVHSGITNVSWVKGSAGKIESGRVGSGINPIDADKDAVLFVGVDPNGIATRTDVVLALYYYASMLGDMSRFHPALLGEYHDFNVDIFYENKGKKIDIFENLSHELYCDDYAYAWAWAVYTDIIEGYPDRTLGLYERGDDSAPHKYVTRAEYAVILDRFLKYLDIRETYNRPVYEGSKELPNGLYYDVSVPRIEDFSGTEYYCDPSFDYYEFSPLKSAVYKHDGIEENISVDDPRLIRLLNFLTHGFCIRKHFERQGIIPEEELKCYLRSESPMLEIEFDFDTDEIDWFKYPEKMLISGNTFIMVIPPEDSVYYNEWIATEYIAYESLIYDELDEGVRHYFNPGDVMSWEYPERYWLDLIKYAGFDTDK